jgi:hypothetical protein
MEKFIDLLKELGILFGAISSLYKSYKEVVKPWLAKRRRRILLKRKNKKL